MVKLICKILLGIAIILTWSCQQDDNYVDAQLVGLIDNIYWARWERQEYPDETNGNDTLPSHRNLILVYRIVNTYRDSIFLPRKRYINNFSSNIVAYRPNMNDVYIRNMEGPAIIAPKDTAYIRFMVYRITSIKEEEESSPSYADILSSLKLKYTLNPADRKEGIHNIDSIIFHNDTTGIWTNYTEPGIFIDYE